MQLSNFIAITGTVGLVLAGAANAGVITPEKYPTAPSQASDVWYTDRYAPAAFENIGSYQGRDDVLRIGIDESDSQANRTSHTSAFYNTQGRKYDVGVPYVASLSASVYLSDDWSQLSGTDSRRTDMWATISPQGTPACAQSNCNLFPIVSFVSDDDGARFRIWDSNTQEGWQDLAMALSFDAWYDLEMEWTGVGFEYYINGDLVYSDSTISQVDPSFGSPLLLSNIIMQGYNYGGTYDAHWADIQVTTDVPEPATLALFGLGLLGLGARARSRKRA